MFVIQSNLYIVCWNPSINRLTVCVHQEFSFKKLNYKFTCPSKPRSCSIGVYFGDPVVAYTLEHTSSVFFWTTNSGNSFEGTSEQHCLKEVDEIEFTESTYCACILYESDSKRFSIIYLENNSGHWVFDSVCQLRHSSAMQYFRKGADFCGDWVKKLDNSESMERKCLECGAAMKLLHPFILEQKYRCVLFICNCMT